MMGLLLLPPPPPPPPPLAAAARSPPVLTPPAWPPADIGANLLDSMYSGSYNGKEYHAPDLQPVLQRALDAGVQRLIITAGNLEEARKALALARTHGGCACLDRACLGCACLESMTRLGHPPLGGGFAVPCAAASHPTPAAP